MGFLSASPADDAAIQAMGEGGNTTTELPGASGLDGLLTAIPKGVTSGLDKVAQLGTDFSATDFGSQAVGALMMQNPNVIRGAATYAQDVERSSANVKAIQQWAATGQDPRVTGGIGRIAAGTSEQLTIATAGAAAGGPWGSAALLGSAEGYSSYLQGKADGLDDTTAKEQASITAVSSAASAFLPIKFGKTAMQSVFGGIASNVAIGMANRGAMSAVLSANGYKAMADQQRVFDGQAMLADSIMGAAFGAYGHFTHGGGTEHAPVVNPADVDAAAATLNEAHFNRSAPGIPTDPAIATLHADTMTHSIDAMLKGDEPNITEQSARELLAGSLPDPAHDMMPSIVDAAHAELPGFTDAIRPMTEVAPPVRESGPRLEPLLPKTEGEPAPTPLADEVSQRLNPLVQKYGDIEVTREDGTVGKLSDVANEMQQQAADADNLAKAHEAVASCFLRTGGAA
jgi:hypothetical protein